MPKNIVMCCDGTGNEVAGNLSNVLKLLRIARKNDTQRVFYDPGIRTIGHQNAWTRFKQKAQAIFGLATGAGLDDNILSAYRFLAKTYEEGDHVFLFRFSRGAYTVRALAGFIHMIGLLKPDQLNIADYALTAYKRASEESDFNIAWRSAARSAPARDRAFHGLVGHGCAADRAAPRPHVPAEPRDLALYPHQSERAHRPARYGD